MKESRQVGSLLGCWFTSLMKESRQAGSLLGLLVYYLSEVVKAGWESFRSAGLLP